MNARHTLVPLLAAVLALTGCTSLDVVPSPAGVEPAAAPASAPESAAEALAALPVKGRAAKTGYSRAVFMPRGWDDPDGNGCDARRDTLARQAVRDVVRAGSRQCVLTAVVHDPYSGTDIASTDADVDHVVALADAWQTGAQQLDQPRREALANHPINLVATAEGLNRSKGDRNAASWLPPAKSYRCQFVARQVAVKQRYGLWLVAAERDAIARVLEGCPGEPLPT